MAEVRLNGVHKIFAGGTTAVDHLDLVAPSGELTVLVGPSGCGKSTILRLIAGLTAATAGEILIAGREVNDLGPGKRGVAMVFQEYALYPHMSVRENLAFPLRMQHIKKDARERQVDRIAELLRLEGLLDRRPAALSGGQRQRVAMGRALIREVSVVLLDEPLSNLDAKLRLEIRTEIAALQRSLKMTMIYVTHDQVEAMTLGDRVAVLEHGRLRQVAAPGELFDRPADTFVASFLGNPGMNLLTATVDTGGPVPRLCCEGMEVTVTDPQQLTVLASRPGQRLWCGVRPEGVYPAEKGINAEVQTVERLGHEQLLHCRTAGGQDLVVRIGGQGQTPGRSLTLGIRPGALHLFDEKGVRIP